MRSSHRWTGWSSRSRSSASSLRSSRSEGCRPGCSRCAASPSRPRASWIGWSCPPGKRTPPRYLAQGLGSSALARRRSHRWIDATALLTELTDIRASVHKGPYFAWLPSFVRAALSMDDLVLAERLAKDLEPRSPYAQHAVVAIGAALAESRGELEPAADGYADVAARWSAFGVVPEQAFALLGQGRCLVGLDRSTQAGSVLRQARRSSAPRRGAVARGDRRAAVGHASRGMSA